MKRRNGRVSRVGGRALAVSLVTLGLLSASGAALAARTSSPPPKNPASCRTKTGAKCKSTSSKPVTQSSKPTGTKPAGKSDQWPFDGHYAGTETISVTASADGHSGQTGTATPLNFVVVHGKTTLLGAVGSVSNLGQIEVVIRQSAGGGTFSMGGTVFFVRGANDAVQVHGDLHIQGTGGSAVMLGEDVIKASRISR